jgi:hypothetical protein
VKRYDECKLKFKCSVTANGAKYDSPSGFKRKKLAQNAAVEAAVRDLLKQSLLMLFEFAREEDAYCLAFYSNCGDKWSFICWRSSK